MREELIREIIKYVEETEVAWDAQVGDVRTLEQLIRDDRMPAFYAELVVELTTKEILDQTSNK